MNRRIDLATTPLPFLILGTGRVGSNYLITLLNQHPEVICHYEVFNREKIHYAPLPREERKRLDQQWEPTSRDKDPQRFLRELLGLDAGNRVAGFKLFPSQNDDILNLCLNEPKITKVVQRRRDVLRMYVSDRIALKTGRWMRNTESEEIPIEDKRIQFKPLEFLRDIENRDRFYRRVEMTLLATRQEYVALDYEDLVEYRGESLRRIFQRLGVAEDYTTGDSGLVRQNPESLEDLVTNHEEMHRFLLMYDFGESGFRPSFKSRFSNRLPRAWRKLRP